MFPTRNDRQRRRNGGHRLDPFFFNINLIKFNMALMAFIFFIACLEPDACSIVSFSRPRSVVL